MNVATIRTDIHGHQYLRFLCPACKCSHMPRVVGPEPWIWNGDLEKPTLQPSVRVTYYRGDQPDSQCHSQVTDGQIFFYPDTTRHQMAGQTMPLPPIDHDESDE